MFALLQQEEVFVFHRSRYHGTPFYNYRCRKDAPIKIRNKAELFCVCLVRALGARTNPVRNVHEIKALGAGTSGASNVHDI